MGFPPGKAQFTVGATDTLTVIACNGCGVSQVCEGERRLTLEAAFRKDHHNRHKPLEYQMPKLSEGPPVYGSPAVTHISAPSGPSDRYGWEQVESAITQLLRHATKAYHELGLDPNVFVPETSLGPAVDTKYRPRALGWFTQTSMCSAVLTVDGSDWHCVLLGEHTKHKCDKYEWCG